MLRSFAAAAGDNHDHGPNYTRSAKTELNRPAPANIRVGNQVRKYAHDPAVDQILKSVSSKKNSAEKEIFNTIVKTAAVGLFKLYKSKNKAVKEETDFVIKYLAENLDGRSFTQLNKLLHDLRHNVLNDPNHTLSADSFLVFLDKVRELTPIESRN